jgi:hypothetical protein
MTRADQPSEVAAAGGPAAALGSAWSPFRHRLFAAMWGAQFVSNIGSWMQTVAAQWLMLTLTSSAAYVALVQTAAGLPVVLFAVLAGTIGDLVDRRRFLLLTQAFMLVAAAALGALAIAGLVTPWVLLALVFAVGTGQALTSPTWQTLQPELVAPPEDLLPAGDWPAPHLTTGHTPQGPVLVSVEYRARPGLEDELMTALHQARFSRRRTGATSWRAWQDASDPSRILEQFVVASWDEHLRQHERVTRRDQDRLDRIRQMTDPARPVTVTHWLVANPEKASPAT